MYLNGQGVAQDHALAHEWYLRAAEQGHANAQFVLGIMYELGLGVERNLGEARQWMERAAAALMLVSARLRYMAGQKWGTQRYLSMRQEEFNVRKILDTTKPSHRDRKYGKYVYH